MYRVAKWSNQKPSKVVLYVQVCDDFNGEYPN